MKKAIIKKKLFKFYSLEKLAKHLGESEGFLLYLVKNHETFHYFKPRVKIKNKYRDFFVARPPLKRVLRSIDTKILDRLSLPDTFQGGFKGKSLLNNAQTHVGAYEILKIDIQDFFPSISPGRIQDCFYNLGMKSSIARLLSKITTVVVVPKSHLPQGFITSPKIAALTLLKFENRLNKLAIKYGLIYTFWIDDITISGNFPVHKFKNTIIQMLEAEGFKVNAKKIVVMTNQDRMEVNGVVINKFPNIPSEKRDYISKMLYSLCKTSPKGYLANNGVKPTDDNVEDLRNKLLGNIHFTLSINKKLGEKYKKIFSQIQWYATP